MKCFHPLFDRFDGLKVTNWVTRVYTRSEPWHQSLPLAPVRLHRFDVEHLFATSEAAQFRIQNSCSHAGIQKQSGGHTSFLLFPSSLLPATSLFFRLGFVIAAASASGEHVTRSPALPYTARHSLLPPSLPRRGIPTFATGCQGSTARIARAC